MQWPKLFRKKIQQDIYWYDLDSRTILLLKPLNVRIDDKYPSAIAYEIN